MTKPITVDDDTKFCPADWIDEYAPVLVAHPDELLMTAAGRWFIEDTEDDDPEKSTRTALFDGQVVGFAVYRNYGLCTLDIHEDGTWSGDWPEDANRFRHIVADDEDVTDDIDELIRNTTEWAHVPLEPGAHDVFAWYWSAEGVPFRFEIFDGKGRFTRVEAADVH